VDYAPLTPYYFNNSSVPPQGCVCGINLTTPNYVCNVTQDLNAGVNNVCFNVLAYNVTIQCNGHSIIGRIYSNQNRTSVLGCNVSAYGHEILYNHTSNGLISGVTAIGISASDAIELSYSTNTTISNTNASSIYPGIRIEYGTGNSILNTRSTSSSYQGIIFVSSNGNQIVNSRAIAQGDQPGLWLYGDSSNNLVKDSVLSSNNGKALYLSGSSGTGASNNTIANNTLLSNSTLLALNYATNNLFYWNNFTQTNGYYIYDDSYAYGQYLNRFNATINGKPEGNIYANVLNGSVAIQGNVSSGYGQNLYIGMNGTGYPYKAATAQGKIYDPYNEVYDYAPLTPYYYGNNTTQQSCTCGNLTTPNYVCNVTQDLNSNGTCFTVYADNVTIQCNGHTITGDNQTGTYGVFSTRQSTTVKNCTISNYQNAILLESATNGLVLDNRLSTTHPTGYLGSGQWGKGYALWLTLSHGTVVRNNQVNATSSGIAIYSVNSNNSVIVGNNATASGHTGISVNGESIGASTGVAVENNTVYGNPAIELGSLSYSSVSGNNATGSGTGGGITMYGPDHCVIRGNRALSSGVGIQQGSAIQLYWANNNTLADNFANCSGGANGIDIAYSSSDNNVTNNTAASTSGTGLYIGYGSNANTGYCYRNSVDGNTVVSGGQAARLENAQIGTVSGNTFISAGGNSNLLYILGSGNTVYWNNFSATNGYYASIAGGNKLNTTINGKPEGNIYANVISGAVAVQGNVTSGYGAGLYIGMNGTGYPYSQATSQGKIVGNAVDYAPLTPFYAADSMPPPAPPSDDGNATARENVTRIEIPRPKQSPPEQVAEDEEPASKAAPKTTSKTEPVKTTPKGEPAPKTTPKADGKAAQKGEPESEPAATPKSVPKPASKAEPVPRITPKAEPAAKAEQKPAPAPAQKAEPTQAIAPKKAEPAAKGEAPAAAKREPAPQAATEAPAEAGAMASG
jgi:hypothetical protein